MQICTLGLWCLKRTECIYFNRALDVCERLNYMFDVRLFANAVFR